MILYKYCGPARLDVLQRERIRFTQPAALNDPFELRPYFDQIAPDDAILRHLASMDLMPHIIELYEDQPDEVKAKVPLVEPARTAILRAAARCGKADPDGAHHLRLETADGPERYGTGQSAPTGADAGASTQLLIEISPTTLALSICRPRACLPGREWRRVRKR